MIGVLACCWHSLPDCWWNGGQYPSYLGTWSDLLSSWTHQGVSWSITYQIIRFCFGTGAGQSYRVLGARDLYVPCMQTDLSKNFVYVNLSHVMYIIHALFATCTEVAGAHCSARSGNQPGNLKRCKFQSQEASCRRASCVLQEKSLDRSDPTQ